MSALDHDQVLPEQRRREALERSAWGEPFVFFQPRNLCFWVFVALTGVGVFHIWQYFQPRAEFFAEAYVVGAILCGLCGLAWALWLHHVDRWERQPLGLVLAALLWGAIPATFAFAITVNGAMLNLYAKWFGQEWASDWAAGFTAPITEEAAKLCGFVLIMGLAPRLVRTANDGLIIGAFVGLGFAAFENFLYAANGTLAAFGTDPVGGAVKVSFVRIAVSFVSHPLFSALVCSGFVYLIGTTVQRRRPLLGIGFVVAGMFLHFTWDNATGLGFGHNVLVLVVMVGSIILAMVLLTIAFRLAVGQEHQFVRDILAPEVAAGVLSEAEVEATLDKKAGKAYRKAAPNHHARKGRKHLRHAILDLTHAIGASRGAESDDVSHARAEVARIRAMAEPQPAA